MTGERTIWYELDLAAPVLPEDAFALAFTLVPGEDEAEPALSLHASWRVSGPHARLYGGRISGAIQIVAVDRCSGRAWVRSAEPDHVVPFSPKSPLPGRASKGPIAASGNFSVDLLGHLGLPRTPASYAVFLWLDEVVSPVQLCEVPGPFPPFDASFVDFAPVDAGEGAAGVAGDVSLRASGTRVQGTAYLSPRTPGGGLEPVTALALFDRPHLVGWRAELLPANFGRDEEWRFAFDLTLLLPPRGEKPKKAFVLALTGGVLSSVATVEV